ncbi:MAG: glycosyltransferase family 1 protein [Chloroflexi bacterium]|nr:glycosyltransferase family 1 protein [Chloroflexota bacterium]
MPLRIAIDASRATSAQPTGTENYARRLIQALVQANESRQEPDRYALYFRDDPAPELFPESAHVELIVLRAPRLWTHLRWARALWKAKPDITFAPAHTLPFIFPGAGIVTAHDLGYKRFPASHPAMQRAHLDITTRFSQARAALVLADSQATADDLRRLYRTPADKIRVVYPGIDAPDELPSPAAIKSVRAKLRLPERYFLFVGTLQPRKNIRRLAQAFTRWQREHEDDETGLVLTGAKGWLFEDVWLAGASNVQVTGYVDEADKAGLLAGSIALVFPSLYEGFGFPAAEAMRYGAPVIASNTSSLPEVVGDAGLLVDPEDVSAIAAAMSRCSRDLALRRQMIERGFKQASRFNWDSAAAQVIDAFHEAGERASARHRAI